MKGLRKHNRISAATVARLVRIREHDREKEEQDSARKLHHYFLARARCKRCVWGDQKYGCERMQFGRYAPTECEGYEKKVAKP